MAGKRHAPIVGPGRCRLSIGESLPSQILCGDNGDGTWPGDGELGVVEAKPIGRLGDIGDVHLVKDLDIIAERLEPMRTTGRDIEAEVVFGGQLKRFPAPMAWRVRPQVGHHVVNGAARAANELYLGMRWPLEVHPAQRACTPRHRKALLGEHCCESVRGERGAVEQAAKTAAFVGMAFNPDRPETRDRCRLEDHHPLLISAQVHQ
jgi:hypothetical protein